MRPIIAILGPTATGKTAVGVRLSQQIGGEIISADSMAVYRGMDIGTAKPALAERSLAAFHLIDVADPSDPFNAAQFKQLASEAINEIRGRGRWPILVGGTGLYARVLLDDFGLTATAADPSVRERLKTEAEKDGNAALHERLRKVDPVSADRIHWNDRVRIVRALEVYEVSGQPISRQQQADAERRTRRRALKFGLTAPREELYRRIDQRVDEMIEAGLVEEVRSLLSKGYVADLPPLQSLGYKEVSAFLAGEVSLGAAVDEIKQNTRRFAKRQLTWFRADKELVWIDTHGKSVEEISQEILLRLPT